MATNTGNGFRFGQQTDRFQVMNLLTNLWDKYDGSANYLSTKKSLGPYKGIEKRIPMKPPRIK